MEMNPGSKHHLTSAESVTTHSTGMCFFDPVRMSAAGLLAARLSDVPEAETQPSSDDVLEWV